MKLKITTLVILLLLIVSFSSCEKEIGVTAGVQVGPVYVDLSFGGGTGPYYGYGNVPPSLNTSVVYIISKPLDQTAIAVFDQNGRQMGVVTCTSGTWQQSNQMFHFLQNWNYSVRRCAVLVQWDQKWTNAPWSGKIIG
jgi:hypothetical protein